MSSKDYTRRQFLETITQATIFSMGITSLAPSRAFSMGKPELKTTIPRNATILFQGDSITDAGRSKSALEPNNAWAMGPGYAFLVTASLLQEFPEKSLKLFNRGISGNKVFQLADRWDEDCLDLKPDILSILVGVNDFWHTVDLDYDGTVETYENDFRTLLKRTVQSLPEVQLIIGEPFALEEGSAINQNWYPEFPKYQEAARSIARDFEAAFIPYQSIFEKASYKVPATYWSEDGVHPTIAGSQLMAQAWLETVKRL